MRVRAADPDDPDASSPRRRRDGDDRVEGGKHERAVGRHGLKAVPCRRYCDLLSYEMWTVFENASPTLSVVTPGTSAAARWTIRRSYGFSGPSC